MAQLFITIGLVFGYFISYATVRISSSMSWRLPLILQSLVALGLALACQFYLPESPRWLNFKGCKEEATVVWNRLAVSGAEGEKDEELIPPGPAQLNQGWKQKVASSMKVFGKVSRKQMMLGVFLMSTQQLSGIDGVLYVRCSLVDSSS
jgi:MFS family permease